MKSHILLRLKYAINPQPPHWERFIQDKSGEMTTFGTHLDAAFTAYRLAVWITSEYRPADESVFDAAEVSSGLNRTYRVILREPERFPDSFIEILRSHDSVLSARLIDVAHTALPEYSIATSRNRRSWAHEMIGLSYAHLFSRGNPEVKIAVLDTGVDVEHPELSGQFVSQKDFVHFEGLDTTSFIGDLIDADDSAIDDVGHGTHVAGIIGAKGHRIPEGVSPNCKMIAVRVLAAMIQDGQRVGAGLIDNINVGIKWAVDQGVDVINMSLGVRHEHGGLPHEDVIRYALQRGVSVIAAAGNDGTNNKYYPGALPGVSAVGAVDQSGSVAAFSSYGARISFLAPGTAILSSYRAGDYGASSGTSQAAPFVSGAVALLRSIALDYDVRLSPEQVQFILKQTADRIDQQPHHFKGGYGVINLTDAVKYLQHKLQYRRG